MMMMNHCGSTMGAKPAWLQALMADTFFGSCLLHENRRKSEKNVFCLHCCLSICPHCLPSHRSHPLLQVYPFFLFFSFNIFFIRKKIIKEGRKLKLILLLGFGWFPIRRRLHFYLSFLPDLSHLLLSLNVNI